MKKATSQQLIQLIINKDNLFCSINHIEMVRNEAINLLFDMPDFELHYNIVGNCIFIFKN